MSPTTSSKPTAAANPTDDQLYSAIEDLILSGGLPQSTGVEKVKAAVKEARPSWGGGGGLTSKRVRECMKRVVEDINRVDGEFGVEDRVGKKGTEGMWGGDGFESFVGTECPFHGGHEGGPEKKKEVTSGGGGGGMNRATRRKAEKARRRASKGKMPIDDLELEHHIRMHLALGALMADLGLLGSDDDDDDDDDFGDLSSSDDGYYSRLVEELPRMLITDGRSNGGRGEEYAVDTDAGRLTYSVIEPVEN